MLWLDLHGLFEFFGRENPPVALTAMTVALLPTVAVALKMPHICITGEFFFNTFFGSLSTTPALCSSAFSCFDDIVGEQTATPPWRAHTLAVGLARGATVAWGAGGVGCGATGHSRVLWCQCLRRGASTTLLLLNSSSHLFGRAPQRSHPLMPGLGICLGGNGGNTCSGRFCVRFH